MRKPHKPKDTTKGYATLYPQLLKENPSLTEEQLRAKAHGLWYAEKKRLSLIKTGKAK